MAEKARQMCFQGRGGLNEESKQREVPSCPLFCCSHLPPCGIFLHECLCHTWGTKWCLSSLSVSLPHFLLTSPLVCATMVYRGTERLVVLFGNAAQGPLCKKMK